MVQFRAGNDRNKKANEIVGGLVVLVMKEGDIVVASDSKSKTAQTHAFETSNTRLEHEICRRCGESRISVESAHQQ